jgi:hypothetical protein
VEPYGVDENCIGLGNQVLVDPDSVLGPMVREFSTPSGLLNWSLKGEDAFVPDSDNPVEGDPHVPAYYFNTGYINTPVGSETIRK